MDEQARARMKIHTYFFINIYFRLANKKNEKKAGGIENERKLMEGQSCGYVLRSQLFLWGGRKLVPDVRPAFPNIPDFTSLCKIQFRRSGF
jgi:hypothetical protein